MSKEPSLQKARRYLIDFIYTQTRMEGIVITIPETEAILENRSLTVEAYTVEVVLMLKRAWEYVLSEIDKPWYLEDLQTLNMMVSDRTNLKPGQLRKNNVYIRCTGDERYYPLVLSEYEYREKFMNSLDQANPALEAFCCITKTQLFENCNKRTAFLFMNKILIEQGRDLITPEPQLQQEFFDLLVAYYLDDSKKQLLINFMETCLSK